MSANSSRYSFHIKNSEIRVTKYFVYNHEKYPVNFDLLKINSNYFNKNLNKYLNEQTIDLIDEKEEYVELTDDSIQAFISSCQNEPCSIESSSIIPLRYLAHKFQFDRLIQI